MSIKTGVRELKKRKYKYLAGALLCLAAVNIQAPDTVWAGSWQQEGSSWWYQEDDGIWPAWQWKETVSYTHLTLPTKLEV